MKNRYHDIFLKTETNADVDIQKTEIPKISETDYKNPKKYSSVLEITGKTLLESPY